jgi:Icc-related predicted phosphoesterase
MRVTVSNKTPIETIPYLEVTSKLLSNGEPFIKRQELPIYLGEFEHEKTDLDFLVVTSDLQGMIEKNGSRKLLGEELPSLLDAIIKIELTDIENPKIGTLLCGDLFTSMAKRGSSGDVRIVWENFNLQSEWVVGVAGNHDMFGTEEELNKFKSTEGIDLLHKKETEKSGITISGISGIIGRGDKPNRVEEAEYLSTLTKYLNKNTDIVLIHETPNYPDREFIGNERIRDTIEQGEEAIICCGHCYWDDVIVNFENGSTILNVDSKVLVLKKKCP